MMSPFDILIQYLSVSIGHVVDMYFGIRTKLGDQSNIKWINFEGLHCRRDDKPTDVVLIYHDVRKFWKNEQGQY